MASSHQQLMGVHVKKEKKKKKGSCLATARTEQNRTGGGLGGGAAGRTEWLWQDCVSISINSIPSPPSPHTPPPPASTGFGNQPDLVEKKLPVAEKPALVKKKTTLCKSHRVSRTPDAPPPRGPPTATQPARRAGDRERASAQERPAPARGTVSTTQLMKPYGN